MKNHWVKISSVAAVCLISFSQIAAAQICNSDITETAPVSDFELHDDGTVTHLTTGLVWMRCALGQTWENNSCTGTAEKYDWLSAIVLAENTSFAGQTDWRMPNIKELESISELSCISPALNLTVFPNSAGGKNSSYWNSTPYPTNGNSVWRLNAARKYYKQMTYEAGDYLVRLVRN